MNFYRLMPETPISPVNDNDSSYVIFLETVVNPNEHFIPNGTSGTLGLQRHPAKSRPSATRLWLRQRHEEAQILILTQFNFMFADAVLP